MARSSSDEEREQRIAMDIIVDAYGPEEQAAGWYVYLTDHLRFPFTAHCVVRRSISPWRSATRSTSWRWRPKRSASTRCLSASDGTGVPSRCHWRNWKVFKWTRKQNKPFRTGAIGSTAATNCKVAKAYRRAR
jgi:hypothetical protein